MVVQSECCAEKHAVCTSSVDVGSVFMVVQCVCAVLWTDLRGHAVCTSGIDVESVCMVVQSVWTLWTDLGGHAVCTSGVDVEKCLYGGAKCVFTVDRSQRPCSVYKWR